MYYPKNISIPSPHAENLEELAIVLDCEEDFPLTPEEEEMIVEVQSLLELPL